jgi:hypothetical protein
MLADQLLKASVEYFRTNPPDVSKVRMLQGDFSTPAFVEDIVRELIQDKAVGSRSTRITGILRDFE